jgi:hypothetical protein
VTLSSPGLTDASPAYRAVTVYGASFGSSVLAGIVITTAPLVSVPLPSRVVYS